MKIICIALLLLLSGCGVTKPIVSEEKEQLFISWKYTSPTSDYGVAIGDSIAYGVAYATTNNINSLFSVTGIQWLNCGQPGATIKDLIKYNLWKNDVIETNPRPKYVILSIGINDIFSDEIDSYKQNIVELINQATSLGIKVYVFNIMPTKRTVEINNSVVALNSFLRDAVSSNSLVVYVNNYSLMINNSTASGLEDDLFSDTVHPNNDGYYKIISNIDWSSHV